MPEKKKRESRFNLRGIFIRVFLGFLIVLILFANLPELRKAWWQWQLNQAQKKWEQNEPIHYRYDRITCSMRCVHIIITVENGEIVEAVLWRDWYEPDEIEVNPPELPIVEPIEDLSTVAGHTIESQFHTVKQGLNFTTAIFHVEYDSHYGFPSIITILFCDESGICSNEDFSEYSDLEYHISDFEVLQER